MFTLCCKYFVFYSNLESEIVRKVISLFYKNCNNISFDQVLFIIIPYAFAINHSLIKTNKKLIRMVKLIRGTALSRRIILPDYYQNDSGIFCEVLHGQSPGALNHKAGILSLLIFYKKLPT